MGQIKSDTVRRDRMTGMHISACWNCPTLCEALAQRAGAYGDGEVRPSSDYGYGLVM